MLVYLQQEGLLKKAIADAELYLARIREFIPSEYLKTFSNHCWERDIKLQVNGSTHVIRGKYGSQTFSMYEDPYEDALHSLVAVKGGHYHNARYALPLACIPEVFLAGFPKCGSRYLYDQLTSHPSVITPMWKEPHWWIHFRHFTSQDSERTLYFVEYLINYRKLVQRLLQSRGKPHLVSVDSSPSKMFFSPLFTPDRSEVNYCLLPAVIPQVLPRAKFLVVMRNPIDYLYSAFWHSCTRQGGNIPKRVQPKGPDIFHERIVQKIKAFKLCMKDQTLPLAKCVLDMTPNIFSSELPCGTSRLETALYYVHVHKWLSVVPRNRFLLLTLEELSADTNGVMAKVWAFLGLPHVTLRPIKKSRNQQEKVDYHHNPQLTMRIDTRELLDEFFAPYNRMLADLAGDEKFLWNRS